MLELEYSIFCSNISIELLLTILLFFISDLYRGWVVPFWDWELGEYILILKIKYNTKKIWKSSSEPFVLEEEEEEEEEIGKLNQGILSYNLGGNFVLSFEQSWNWNR